MRADSTKRMSPPTGVQARPVATPGTEVRWATSFSKRVGPSTSATSSASKCTLVDLALGDAHGRAAQQRADLPLEAAAAGLAGVLADDA